MDDKGLQIAISDYQEVFFSPVVKMATIRSVIALVASKG